MQYGGYIVFLNIFKVENDTLEEEIKKLNDDSKVSLASAYFNNNIYNYKFIIKPII